MQLPANPRSRREEFISFDSPIGLLQELLSQHGGSSTIDKLTQSLQRQTGVTWNNRFKKQHGTLGKVCPPLSCAPPPYAPPPCTPSPCTPPPCAPSPCAPPPCAPPPCAPPPCAPPPCAPSPCAPPLVLLAHVPLPFMPSPPNNQ